MASREQFLAFLFLFEVDIFAPLKDHTKEWFIQNESTGNKTPVTRSFYNKDVKARETIPKFENCREKLAMTSRTNRFSQCSFLDVTRAIYTAVYMKP